MLIPDGSGACPQTVRYSNLNPDGSYQEARYLYPENLTETKIEPDPDEKDWVYMLYNHDTPDDANNDRTVSRHDAVLLQKWLFASGDAQYIDGEAADLDQDGTLNAIDLTLMKRELLCQ